MKQLNIRSRTKKRLRQLLGIQLHPKTSDSSSATLLRNMSETCVCMTFLIFRGKWNGAMDMLQKCP